MAQGSADCPEIAGGGCGRWAIPWPCVNEFLAIVTHPHIFVPPTSLEAALKAARAWLDSPSCRLIAEGPGYFEVLQKPVLQAKARGPEIHDARVGAICLVNGMRELWSAGRDFSRFRELKALNPLVRRGKR